MRDACTGRALPVLPPSGARRAADIETPSSAARPRFPHWQRDNRLQPASNTLGLFRLNGLPGRWALRGAGLGAVRMVCYVTRG